MLEEAKYFIYRFGYEGLLQSFVQKDLPQMKKGDMCADKIKSMPDFVVMDKEGNVSFVEVKFRAQREVNGELRERIGRAARYWPEARLLIVYPSEPHFMISSFPAFARTGKLYPLERDKFLRVNKELIADYGDLIKNYIR